MIRLGNPAPGGVELKEVEPAVSGTRTLIYPAAHSMSYPQNTHSSVCVYVCRSLTHLALLLVYTPITHTLSLSI